MRISVKQIIVLSIVILLSACSTTTNNGRYSQQQDSAPRRDIDVSNVPDAVPRDEPLSKYGNPRSYVVYGKRYYVKKTSKGYHERGIASWYGMKFHNHRTSSGENYDIYAMTAASRTLPLPTYARVTNLQNNRSVIVKVNDRGPFAKNRIMDLSYAAAKKLGVTAHGTALVDIVAIDPKHYVPGESQSQLFGSAPVIKEPGSPLIYLQLGAFSQYDNALRMQDDLKAFTHKSVRIKTIDVNGKPVYKVQIGPIPSVAASDELSQRLAENGFGNAMATVE
jgi:rare lipoprotein A